MTATDSIIVPIHAGDARLVSLGLYQLSGPLEDSRALPSHETLVTRFDAAEGVMADRQLVANAEKSLAAGRAPETYRGKPKADDFVQARLTLHQLELTVAALQAFRDREDPTVDRFDNSAQPKLIDPHSVVEKVIARYESAAKVCRTSSELAGREASLLQ